MQNLFINIVSLISFFVISSGEITRLEIIQTVSQKLFPKTYDNT